MQCSAMQYGYVCMLHVCMYTYWRIMLPTCPHRTFPYPNIYPSFFWQEGPSGRHRFGPVTVVCFCFTIYRTQNGCGKWNPSLNQSTRRKSGTPQKKRIYVMIAPSFSVFLSHWFHFFSCHRGFDQSQTMFENGPGGAGETEGATQNLEVLHVAVGWSGHQAP